MTKIKFEKKTIICLIICLAVIVVGIVLDLVTKQVFHNMFVEGKLPIDLIPEVLEFTYTLNDGAAWGSLSGFSILFFILTVLALPAFCFVMLTRLNNGYTSSIGFAMVIAGTIGNAVDRGMLGDGFFDGKVRDFIAVKFLGGLNFVCNVADIFLTVGVVVVILGMLFFDKDGIFKKQPITEKPSIKTDDNDYQIDNNKDNADEVIEDIKYLLNNFELDTYKTDTKENLPSNDTIEGQDDN